MMTETKPLTATRSSSDESLVLVESGDAFSVSDSSPSAQEPSVTASFSDEIEEQEATPILASEVQLVENVPQSKSIDSISIDDGNDTDSEGSEKDVDNVSKEHKVGAGIAVGIVTAPFCGPALAVVAGVAAAYGTSQKGFAGDACRAAGDIALVAKEKAIEVDRKHDIVKTTRSGANKLIEKAKDVNEEHHILEKMKQVVICTLKNVAAALQLAAEKMKESREKRRNAREATYRDANEELSKSFSYEEVVAEGNQK